MLGLWDFGKRISPPEQGVWRQQKSTHIRFTKGVLGPLPRLPPTLCNTTRSSGTRGETKGSLWATLFLHLQAPSLALGVTGTLEDATLRGREKRACVSMVSARCCFFELSVLGSPNAFVLPMEQQGGSL